MLPVNFPQVNKTFVKPEGMTDEECSSLPTYFGQTRNNIPLIISKWQPSREDIDAINRGEGIYLVIYGHFMPPVELTTENPFAQSEVHTTE